MNEDTLEDLGSIECFIARQTTPWKLRVEPTAARDGWIAVLECETHEIIGEGCYIGSALENLVSNIR